MTPNWDVELFSAGRCERLVDWVRRQMAYAGKSGDAFQVPLRVKEVYDVRMRAEAEENLGAE